MAVQTARIVRHGGGGGGGPASPSLLHARRVRAAMLAPRIGGSLGSAWQVGPYEAAEDKAQKREAAEQEWDRDSDC